MLNDVHPPPLEPEYQPGNHPPKRRVVTASTPAARAGGGQHLSDRNDRPHALERENGRHSEGVDLVYPEPEDRGDSFNTTMSAVIVGSVLLLVLIVGGMILHKW